MPNGANLEQFQFSLRIVLYKALQIVLNHVVVFYILCKVWFNFFLRLCMGDYLRVTIHIGSFYQCFIFFSSTKAFPFFLCYLSSS